MGNLRWTGVKGEVPGPKSRELLAARQKYVPGAVYNVTPVFAEKASGAVITDVDGNEYIDFAGGIGVLNVGSCPPEVVEAVREQAGKLIHSCFHVVMYAPYVQVAEKLCSLTPGKFPKKAFLVNSGAEAVENAVKLARKYTRRPAIVALENSFHGRTFLAMTLTSKVRPYKWGFGPFAPEVYRAPGPYCYRCPFGQTRPGCSLDCARALERMVEIDISPDNVAAVVVEPVQGEGGIIVCPDEYLRHVRAICDRHGLLYVDDEIQTGWGRTGKLFAVEHAGVVPDILVSAKALAAGLPLSAVVARAEIMDAVHVGGVGGTYAGNPLACVAALRVMEMMERLDLPARAEAIGRKLMARLSRLKDDHPIIGDVRGRGAMWAVEFVTDRESKEPAVDVVNRVIEYGYKHGLVLMKAGELNNVVRFLPPLVITDEQLDQGLDIFAEALKWAGR